LSETPDTATYKHDTCYQCGGQMGSFTLKDTWKMRIDGALHQVPVYSVPCLKCLSCGTTVLNGTSDEMVHYCYVQYCKEHGLWTRWHRFCRWVRHRLWVYQCRYWWYQLKFSQWRAKWSRSE
jgi:hypothetical protein